MLVYCDLGPGVVTAVDQESIGNLTSVWSMEQQGQLCRNRGIFPLNILLAIVLQDEVKFLMCTPGLEEGEDGCGVTGPILGNITSFSPPGPRTGPLHTLSLTVQTQLYNLQ